MVVGFASIAGSVGGRALLISLPLSSLSDAYLLYQTLDLVVIYPFRFARCNQYSVIAAAVLIAFSNENMSLNGGVWR